VPSMEVGVAGKEEELVAALFVEERNGEEESNGEEENGEEESGEEMRSGTRSVCRAFCCWIGLFDLFEEVYNTRALGD
jgi:hypothetical protein